MNETNRLGKTFHKELGVKYGTKYSLFMNNRIEYVTNWFGGLRNCFERHSRLTPTLSGFEILKDATLIIEVRPVYGLFLNIFYRLNFADEYKFS